jgi:hypothetical protein
MPPSTSLLLHAALGRGGPSLEDERLPNLSVVVEDPNTVWEPVKIANWYGSEERTV